MSEHDNQPHHDYTHDEANEASNGTEKVTVDSTLFSTFYDLWFSGLEGFIEVRPRPNALHKDVESVKVACWKRRVSFEINDRTKSRLLAHLERCAKDPEMAHAGIYISVCPRNTALRRDQELKVMIGGRNEDVEMYPGVVFDLDDHRASDVVSLSHGSEMVQALTLVGIPPTILTKSGTGGGVHGWYRFATPVDVGTGQRLGKKLATLLQSDMAVTNPGRVMRVPGSWNTKSGMAAPVTILEVSGEIHDPVSFEKALEMIAREYGIDLSEAEHTSSQGHSGDAGVWPSLKPDEARRITEVCARIAYYATPKGANSMSYSEWFGLATVLHSLTPDDSTMFEELSRLYDGHDPGEIRDKWKRVRNTSPVTCQWFQSQRPLPQCESCRFYEKNREEGETI